MSMPMSGLSADQRTTVLNIPPEILAYIFELGTESGLSESIEDTDDRRPSGEFLDDEVKRERKRRKADGQKKKACTKSADNDRIHPHNRFPTTVSHVCRYWRNVSTSDPVLWTHHRISWFTCPLRVALWLCRSKLSLLDIQFDVQDPESLCSHQIQLVECYLLDKGGLDDVEDEELFDEHCAAFIEGLRSMAFILGLLVPKINCWERFSFNSNHAYVLPVLLLNLKLKKSEFKKPEQPTLKELHLRSCQRDENGFEFPENIIFAKLKKLFGHRSGGLLNLSIRATAFPLPVARNDVLRNLELVYNDDDGPQVTYQQFEMVVRGAHYLESLIVSNITFDPLVSHRKPSRITYLPHLVTLKFAGLLENDAELILNTLHAPSLQILHLTWDMETYYHVVQRLIQPLPKKDTNVETHVSCSSDFCRSTTPADVQSMMANVRELKLGAYECDGVESLLEASFNLEKLHLKRLGVFEPTCALLSKPSAGIIGTTPSGALTKVPCPALKDLIICHPSKGAGKELVRLAKARHGMGVPIETLQLSRRMADFKYVKEGKWNSLKKFVGKVEWVNLPGDDDDDVASAGLDLDVGLIELFGALLGPDLDDL